MAKTYTGLDVATFTVAPLGGMSASSKFIYLDRKLSRITDHFGVSLYRSSENQVELGGRTYDNHMADLIHSKVYLHDAETLETLDLRHISANPPGSDVMPSHASVHIAAEVERLLAGGALPRRDVRLLPVNFVPRNSRRRKGIKGQVTHGLTHEQILLLANLYLIADLGGVVKEVDTTYLSVAASLPTQVVESEIVRLEEKGVIAGDDLTAEMWLVEWFMNGVFRDNARRQGAARCVQAIASDSLRGMAIAAAEEVGVLAEKAQKKQTDDDKPSQAKPSQAYPSQAKPEARAEPTGLDPAAAAQFNDLPQCIQGQIARLWRRASERPGARAQEDVDNLTQIIRISAEMAKAEVMNSLQAARFPSDGLAGLRKLRNAAEHEKNAARAAQLAREKDDAKVARELKIKMLVGGLGDKYPEWERQFVQGLQPHERGLWASRGLEKFVLRDLIFKSLCDYQGLESV